MFILKKEHQPGVYVPLRALFLVIMATITSFSSFRQKGNTHLKSLILSFSPLHD